MSTLEQLVSKLLPLNNKYFLLGWHWRTVPEVRSLYSRTARAHVTAPAMLSGRILEIRYDKSLVKKAKKIIKSLYDESGWSKRGILLTQDRSKSLHVPLGNRCDTMYHNQNSLSSSTARHRPPSQDFYVDKLIIYWLKSTKYIHSKVEIQKQIKSQFFFKTKLRLVYLYCMYPHTRQACIMKTVNDYFDRHRLLAVFNE